ncbi:transcription factor ste11 [Rhypophila sp. PSN 637]
MEPHTPPSPDPSRFEGLPTGFNELLQHNAATPSSYHRDGPGIEPNQVRSQPTSRYGTPIQQLQRHHTLDSNVMQYQQRPGSAQPSQQYGYRQTTHHQHDSNSSPYPPMPDPYSTPATSPPTPSRASDMITTRSGNAIHRNAGSNNTLGPKSTRIEKPGAANRKKRKADKAGKVPKNVPNLDKPMSEITLEVDVPVANIEEYVNRSSDVRRQEVEIGKNPGRIKRPMNAFMLYRKAYQLRAKEWASQHNHQVVSRVCGLSWPMEPEHVREQFKAWAETERDNHQKAHPDYKFTPSKPAAKPSSAKSPTSQSHFNHSDGSDLDDLDWGNGANGNIHRGGSYMNHQLRPDMRTSEADDYYGGNSLYPPPGYSQYNDMRSLGIGGGRSSYDFPNKLASSYDPRDSLPPVGQYYENTASRLSNHSRQLPAGMVEDVLMSNKGLGSPSQVFHQPHHLYPSHLLLETGLSHQHQHQHQHLQHQHSQHQHSQHQHSQHQHSKHQPSHQHQSSQHQQQQTWQGAGGVDSEVGVVSGGAGGAGGASNAYSNTFSLGLDETLSMDQTSIEQQAQLLRGHPGEWRCEELKDADVEQFDMSWIDPSPTNTKGDN